jgi:ABC-type multidrug transport system ATPase subunit
MPQSIATAAVSPDHAAVPLALEDVGKRYGRREFVLRNLSAVFEPGTATAILGPNGSGKTTLLRLLTCLSFPTEGRITYGDVNLHRHPYRYLAHVGIVHDGAGLPQQMSAEEVLTWILRERTGAADDGRVNEVLEAVRLDERRTEPVGTYSTGMRQKTQLAAALVARPPVLLLDEPFSGLDTESTAATIALLTAFTASGGLLVFSSHQADIVGELADRVLDMEDRQRGAAA